MHLGDGIEKGVGFGRLIGEKHEKVVVAIEELAHFKEVAAEQTQDRPVGLGAQSFGALGQAFGAIRTGDVEGYQRIENEIVAEFD